MPDLIEIKKSDAKQRIVFAEVYAPDRPDSDNEFMTSEEIRKMSYKFMKEQKLSQIDSQHTNELVNGAHVVESFIARKGDPDFIEGAWVLGVHIPNDSDWAKVEKGEWNGFSIEAFVQKELVDIEVELPAQMAGWTMKSEDHQHEFLVEYGEDGSFRGGVTNMVNGHMHIIKNGTVTDIVNGHSHRFSHLENFQVRSV